MTWPDEYVPLNGCRSCGCDFTKTRHFDRHRVGVHGYTYAGGLRMDPPREDGRRCMDADELAAAGLVRLRAGDSPRYESRIASGVPIYWNPEEAAAAGERLRATPNPVEGLRRAA